MLTWIQIYSILPKWSTRDLIFSRKFKQIEIVDRNQCDAYFRESRIDPDKSVEIRWENCGNFGWNNVITIMTLLGTRLLSILFWTISWSQITAQITISASQITLGLMFQYEIIIFASAHKCFKYLSIEAKFCVVGIYFPVFWINQNRNQGTFRRTHGFESKKLFQIIPQLNQIFV